MKSKAYMDFLDKRIPELHRMRPSKYPGRKARDQADREWAEGLKPHG